MMSLLDRGHSASSLMRWSMALLVCAAGCSDGSKPTLPPQANSNDPVAQMKAAISAGQWQAADRFAQQALIANPNDADLITDAAKVAAFCDRKREAAKMLVDAASAAQFQPARRVEFAVQALIDVGELYRAIELLEESLQRNPEEDTQRRFLVGFLAEAQRIDRIQPHLLKLIQNRQFDVTLLVGLTDTSVRRFSSQTSQKVMDRNPDDHRVRYAEAFKLLEQRDAAKAAAVLEEILERHPDFSPAHALYGQALVEQRRLDELPAWIDNAPSQSGDFPDHWLTLGDWSSAGDHHAEAARAYWEATRRDPNNVSAWTRLLRAVQRLGRSDSEFAGSITDLQRQRMEQRVAKLVEFRSRFSNFVTSDQKSQRHAAEVAESLLNLGRAWEAEAWSAIATTLTNDLSSNLPQLRERVIRRLQEDHHWQSTRDQPALTIDLSGLPLPSGSAKPGRMVRSRLKPKRVSTDHIRLREQSDRWGLASVGANNNPDPSGLTALIRSTAAGGGAIDYDLDGRPDIVVMGAGGTMQKTDSIPNQLMRNIGRQFVKVTTSAGVGDRSYGQGVAVGDFNEDGFPDLFFANLGKNVLLANNGDGTFTDCTDRLADGDSQQWTTCGAFVDITQDGIADLLTTNYCDTAAAVDKACPNEEGILGPCPPLEFPADHDQFFEATADGRLVDVTENWVAKASPGRGLGIVTGALDGENTAVYIANDMSANQFYRRAEAETMRLDESAAARGVAVDGRSLAQASMGIASSDFDGDGDLDFYVTGFGREYNVLYEQVSPGIWTDSTNTLGLVRPTLMVVGFGTEAIDLDSDGVDEIIVTNGHIGDFPDPEAMPYEQPLQIFRRGSTGSFQLLDDDSWGDYFASLHVGRALWTVDVNRDGYNDVMITHMRESVRLLLNDCQRQNDRIAFQLVGTRSSRDAVGAVVRFECEGRTRSLWSLAGDGYLCSNERILRAGLGKADRVTDLTVTWQDGSVDQIGALDTNALYVIVQGEGEAFPQHQYRPVQ